MITEKAYAKVNIVLDVLKKRSDSYHDLAGIMHRINLYDEVGIKPASSGIVVKCNEDLPPMNTAYKAALSYLCTAKINSGVIIDIKKSIPSEAGLGGASADAAKVLELMQKLFENALDEQTLYEIGKAVGADVPFCLRGGCCEVRGIGDRLEGLPTQEMYLLLVKGKKGISTKELFSLHDKFYGNKSEDERLKKAIEACKKNDLMALSKNMFNTLETAAFSLQPELSKTKEMLMNETDALTAIMTGSGSVVYGVYESKEKAEKACAKVSGSVVTHTFPSLS